MSAIASFFRVSRTELEAGQGVAELHKQATDLGEDYGWSGYVMLNLLMTLEDEGVALGSGLADEIDTDEDTRTLFFATSADLEAIERLDLNRLDTESVGDGLDLDEDELREAVAESVTLLHQLIAGTGPDDVLVISIE
jgi:hypothetical protein